VARIRTIKPEFFRNEEVAGLSYRARLTWIGLWTYADDEGRGKDNARIIKGDLWPLEDSVTHIEVEADLVELAHHKRITRYVVNGEKLLYVNKWHEHQRIAKPSASKLPPPPPHPSNDANSDTPTTPLPEECDTTTEPLPLGKEQGKEVEVERKTCPVGPDDFIDWYLEYPRKEARAAAERAYTKARKTATTEQLLAGAIRYAQDPNREAQYTKLPATWLNSGCWDDGPLPTRNTTQDHSTRARAKEADMLNRLNATQNQTFLGIEA
jgi:hypothetical protein